MSNATVSSQVYIIRNNSSLSAVSTGTMIVYADGTHVYAKDANGNTYNLCTPNVSNISVSLNDLDDVTLTSLTADATNKLHILRYDVTTSKWINEDAIINLNDLANVNTGTPTTNHYLKWDGSEWIAAAVSGASGISNLYEASDVFNYNSGTNPVDGQTLVWATNEWVPTNTVNAFNVTDGTNSTQIDNGETLTLAGTSPISVAGAGNAFTVSFSGGLNDLSDVAITSLAAGQVIRASSSSAASNAFLSVFDLAEVDAASVTLDGSNGASKVLAWNQTTQKFEPADQLTGASAGNQYDIQVKGSTTGSFAAAPWQIGAQGHQFPVATDATDNFGLATNPVGKGYFGQSGIWLIKDDSLATKLDASYAQIATDGTNGDLIFKAIGHSNSTNYEFTATDTNPAKLILESGSSNNNFSVYAHPSASGNQIIKLPQAMGTAGQVLALSGVSSDNADLDWTDPAPVISQKLINRNMAYYSTNIGGGGGISGVSNPTIPGGDNVNLFSASASYGSANTLTLTALWPYVYKDITFTSFVIGFASLGLQSSDTFDLTITLRSVYSSTAGTLSSITANGLAGNSVSYTLASGLLTSLSNAGSVTQGGIQILVEISNVSAGSSSTNPEIYFDIGIDRKET